MGRHAIAEKLAPKVQEAITTESQVVYIMVELRKLLEYDHLKSEYDIINFYGNWVVHTKLEQSPIADKIVRYFDRLQTGELGSLDGQTETELYQQVASFRNELVEQSVPAKPRDGISRLIGHLPFQNQLRDCLTHFSLPTMLCEDAQFGAFRVQLGKVIEECPLFILKRKRNHQEATTRLAEQEARTRFVESVTVKSRHDELGQVVFEWEPAFHTEPEGPSGSISMIWLSARI